MRDITGHWAPTTDHLSTMKLRDFIVTDSIIAELNASDRDGAIRELVTSLASAGALPSEAVDEVVAALIKREQNGSTGVGKGVAGAHGQHAEGEEKGGPNGRRTPRPDLAPPEPPPGFN